MTGGAGDGEAWTCSISIAQKSPCSTGSCLASMASNCADVCALGAARAHVPHRAFSEFFSEDMLAGFAGADDYLAKPVSCRTAGSPASIRGWSPCSEPHPSRPRTRRRPGKVNHLQGLLPICAYCKKIRNDKNYWEQVEAYISSHADVRFSHGICPQCFEREVRPELEKGGFPIPTSHSPEG